MSHDHGYCSSCQKACPTSTCGSCGGVRSTVMRELDCLLHPGIRAEDHWNTTAYLMSKDGKSISQYKSPPKPDSGSCGCNGSCGCEVKSPSRLMPGHYNGWIPVTSAMLITAFECNEDLDPVIVYNDECRDQNLVLKGYGEKLLSEAMNRIDQTSILMALATLTAKVNTLCLDQRFQSFIQKTNYCNSNDPVKVLSNVDNAHYMEIDFGDGSQIIAAGNGNQSYSQQLSAGTYNVVVRIREVALPNEQVGSPSVHTVVVESCNAP